MKTRLGVRVAALCRASVSALALAGLLWQTALCLAETPANTPTVQSPPLQSQPPAPAEPLPNTDGSGLLPRPPAFKPWEMVRYFAAAQLACRMGCATDFGTLLGSANGVAGWSNCAPTCIRNQRSFLDLSSGEVAVRAQDPQPKNLRYAGIAYQCVEYARRWWMKRLGLAFGDVDGAIDIIYLTQAEDIRTGQTVPLARSLDGTARRPPQPGDLIVYYPDRDNPNWRFGHVAVAVEVDLRQGIVALAEQNYSNAAWEAPQGYARRIRLFAVGGRYTLVDVAPTAVGNPEGGRVAGWVYPLSAK